VGHVKIPAIVGIFPMLDNLQIGCLHRLKLTCKTIGVFVNLFPKRDFDKKSQFLISYYKLCQLHQAILCKSYLNAESPL
jgi:hypothetical protein